MTSKVSRRYAKAVFELLEGSSESVKVADELEAFGRLIEKNREARFVLVYGMTPVEKRKQVVADLAEKMQLSALTKKVLGVLTDASRLRDLLGIASGLRILISAKSNVILMQVKTAEDLNPKLRESIEKKFEKVLNNKVEARYSVDSSLLGGLHVTAAGRTYDGSISGMLGAVQEQFAQGEI